MNALWNQVFSVDFHHLNALQCPAVFLHGRHDLSTSAAVLAQWYAPLRAPFKKLIWFEDSAHVVYEEEPAKVLVSLVQDVLPTVGATRGAKRL